MMQFWQTKKVLEVVVEQYNVELLQAINPRGLKVAEVQHILLKSGSDKKKNILYLKVIKSL